MPALRPSVVAGSAWRIPDVAGSPLVLAAVTGATFALVLFTLITVAVPRELLWFAALQLTLGHVGLIHRIGSGRGLVSAIPCSDTRADPARGGAHPNVSRRARA
jgi:hypothetical protein